MTQKRTGPDTGPVSEMPIEFRPVKRPGAPFCLFQPEAIQTLYMRVLHLLFRFRPECHSMVSTGCPQFHGAVWWCPLDVFMYRMLLLFLCWRYDFLFSVFVFVPPPRNTLGSTSGEHSEPSISWGGHSYHERLRTHVSFLPSSLEVIYMRERCVYMSYRVFILVCTNLHRTLYLDVCK